MILLKNTRDSFLGLDFESFMIGAVVGAAIIIIILKLWEYFNQEPYDPANICGNYSGTNVHLMESGDVSQMIKNYRKIRLEQNTILNLHGGQPIRDTDSIRFSLEKLKKFIYHAESKALTFVDHNGVTIDNDTLGIRFYFAAYSDPAVDPPHNGCENRRTLVMVPTCKNSDGVHVDFDANSNHVDLSSQYIDLYQNTSGQISALNKGYLFPPMP